MLSAAIMQAQLPVITDSALVKLIQGNVTWLTRLDSLKAYMNVGGAADGNGIFSGSDTIPPGTIATVEDNFALSYMTGFAAINIDNTSGQVSLSDDAGNQGVNIFRDSAEIYGTKLKVTSDTFDISGVTVKIGFPSGGSMTSWMLAGSSGTPQTISDGQTATIAAGTGITTTASVTRTVTVAADTSLLATLNDLEIVRDTALKAATHTALINNIALINCTAAPRTVNPPASPVNGDWFAVSDARAASGSNNITVDFVAASQKLYGSTQNYILNTNGGYVKFMYVNANTGWIATKG